MSGLEMLDVLIGLVTIYMIMGIACTAIIEALSAWFGVRSKNLQIALRNMLAESGQGGGNFLTKFNSHPLIQSLSKKKGVKPSYSYLAAETVGQVVYDVVQEIDGDMESALSKLPENSPVKSLLESLWKQTEQDAKQFQAAVTKHFDNIMERASGWYKKRTQTLSIVIAAALVIGANVDFLDLYRSLSNNPALRANVVEIAAAARLDDEDEEKTADPVAGAVDKSQAAAVTVGGAVSDFALGWTRIPETPGGWVSKIIGLLISVFAVSLGAPFWFDLLQRFMAVRTSIAEAEEKKKKKKG